MAGLPRSGPAQAYTSLAPWQTRDGKTTTLPTPTHGIDMPTLETASRSSNGKVETGQPISRPRRTGSPTIQHLYRKTRRRRRRSSRARMPSQVSWEAGQIYQIEYIRRIAVFVDFGGSTSVVTCIDSHLSYHRYTRKQGTV